jgi:hypothetical protein
MVGRAHQDIPPQKISDHLVEPFPRYELTKIFLIKMRIWGWFGENLHKNWTTQHFLKRLAPKFLELLPLQHVLNRAKSENLDWADSVVAYMQWLLYRRIVQAKERLHIKRRRWSSSEDICKYDVQLTPTNSSSGIKLRPTKRLQYKVNDFEIDVK